MALQGRQGLIEIKLVQHKILRDSQYESVLIDWDVRRRRLSGGRGCVLDRDDCAKSLGRLDGFGSLSTGVIDVQVGVVVVVRSLGETAGRRGLMGVRRRLDQTRSYSGGINGGGINDFVNIVVSAQGGIGFEGISQYHTLLLLKSNGISFALETLPGGGVGQIHHGRIETKRMDSLATHGTANDLERGVRLETNSTWDGV